MTTSAFRFCDDLGPKTILHMYEPAIGLKAIAVVDNAAAGTAIGGVRMAPDVSLDECFRLARGMTLKNAAAGLPHGGGKSVIFADPTMETVSKEQLIRAFAQECQPTDGLRSRSRHGHQRSCDGAGSGTRADAVSGLPKESLAESRSMRSARRLTALSPVRTLPKTNWESALEGARIAMQGFGAVGKHAARFFAERGPILVAAADYSGAVHDPAASMLWP